MHHNKNVAKDNSEDKSSRTVAISAEEKDNFNRSETVEITQPWQAPINDKVMLKVEQKVIKQLLQALLFEDIIEFEYSSAQDTNDEKLLDFTIKASADVTYKAQGYIHYSFDIIRFNSAEVKREVEGKTHTALLENVISEILLTIEDANLKDNFIKELRHTLVNEIQAEHLSSNSPKPIDTLSYEELEGYLMAGHPYHPCFKSRIGFDLQDNFNFGPEFQQDIGVVWLAVKKELLATNSTTDIDTIEWVKNYINADNFSKLKDKLIHILTTNLQNKNNSINPVNLKESQNNSQIKASEVFSRYGLIPVHPWQWQNTLIHSLQPLLNTGEVIYLGSVGNQYRAQQSIRSLSMLDHNKAYLKLSMHLINTSSTRILAKHTVMNAAVITNWLNKLVSVDETAQALHIAFLGETVGISLDHEKLQQRGYSHPNIYGGLGAIWRENASQYLSANQKAFPLNGVSYINSDGSRLIDPWVRKYGAKTWVNQLIEVVVPPAIHLLFGHGLALECHAQNIVLVHEEGYPVKIIFKDLHDGVRYSPKHLTKQELKPTLYSLPAAHAALNRGSFIETDDTDGIRDMSVACLFFVALADIAIFMQKHYHYAEADFWQAVATCIKSYQQSHPEHKERFELFDVFAKQTRIESLAKRRLFGDQVFPIKYINNPLSKNRV